MGKSYKITVESVNDYNASVNWSSLAQQNGHLKASFPRYIVCKAKFVIECKLILRYYNLFIVFMTILLLWFFEIIVGFMCVAKGGGVNKYFKIFLFLSANSSYEAKYKETPLTAMLIHFFVHWR